MFSLIIGDEDNTDQDSDDGTFSRCLSHETQPRKITHHKSNQHQIISLFTSDNVLSGFVCFLCGCVFITRYIQNSFLFIAVVSNQIQIS